MNKTVKILLLTIIMILAVMLLCGCGKKENTETNGEDSNVVENEEKDSAEIEETEVVAETKTSKIFAELLAPSKAMYIKYKTMIDTGHGEEEAVITQAAKGKQFYVDTETPTDRLAILQDGTKTYSILHTQKSYIKYEEEVETGIDKVIDNKIFKNAKVAKGTEKVQGVEYEYEEIFSDGEYNRFYYLKGTNILKYLKLSDGQLLEILEYGNDIDETVFSVPEGYTQVSESAN